MGELHISEVLVRQQLQNHGRYLRHSCFGIVLVEKFAEMPVCAVSSREIVVQVRHDPPSVIERCPSCRASTVEAVALFVDAGDQPQRAINVPVAVESGIRMEGERKLERHARAEGVGHERATSS